MYLRTLFAVSLTLAACDDGSGGDDGLADLTILGELQSEGDVFFNRAGMPVSQDGDMVLAWNGTAWEPVCGEIAFPTFIVTFLAEHASGDYYAIAQGQGMVCTGGSGAWRAETALTGKLLGNAQGDLIASDSSTHMVMERPAAAATWSPVPGLTGKTLAYLTDDRVVYHDTNESFDLVSQQSAGPVIDVSEPAGAMIAQTELTSLKTFGNGIIYSGAVGGETATMYELSGTRPFKPKARGTLNNPLANIHGTLSGIISAIDVFTVEDGEMKWTTSCNGNQMTHFGLARGRLGSPLRIDQHIVGQMQLFHNREGDAYLAFYRGRVIRWN